MNCVLSRLFVTIRKIITIAWSYIQTIYVPLQPVIIKKKKVMQEIRIYHSLWRTLLLVLCAAAFTYACVTMLIDPRVNLFMKLIAVIGVVFFGLGSLFMLFMLIRERLAHQPFMTITDKCVIVRGAQAFVVNFSDVEAFEMIQVGSQKFVAIHYKPNVEVQKMEDASFLGRMVRRLNISVGDAQEHLSTSGMSMKIEELFSILNDRLKQA